MKPNPPASSPQSGPESDRDLADSALAWAAASGDAPDLARRVEGSVRRNRRRRHLAIAAGGIFLLAAGSLWFVRHEVSPLALPPAPVVRYSPPEDRRLPDGTLVELRSDARLTVEFSDLVRRVVLESGEAHFSVTKNPARPFVVVAGGVEIRAVGTAFAVDRSHDQIEVLVTEGQVALELPGDATAAPVAAALERGRLLAALGARDRVRIPARPTSPLAPPVVERLSAAEVAGELAWRVPQLTLSSTPLAELIPLFNRYGAERLVLDPAVGELRLGGMLRADNTPALLQLLRNEFGVEAERRDGVLWLHRR